MPPGASEPAFPSASPTRACQPLSAAKASEGAPATRTASANFRTLNLTIDPPSVIGLADRGPPFSIKLFHHLLQNRPLQQGYLGHGMSVLQLRIDAHCTQACIRFYRRVGGGEQRYR